MCLEATIPPISNGTVCDLWFSFVAGAESCVTVIDGIAYYFISVDWVQIFPEFVSGEYHLSWMGWHWKPGCEDYAPSGVPDFDQRQVGWWHPHTYQWSFCGPTAVANCFWWLDSKHYVQAGMPGDGFDYFPLVRDYENNMTPLAGEIQDDHDPGNVNHPDTPWPPPYSPPPSTPQPFVPGYQNPPVLSPWGELVERLAWYMDTDGVRTGYGEHVGTNIVQMEQGIQAWLESEMFPGGSNLTNHVCVVTTPMPSFAHLESLIQEGNNAILLLGFWFEDPPQSEQWWRIGGHYVTVAGVYSDESMIAICDPFIDNAEWGFWGQLEDGRLFPHQHGQHDAAAHNDAGNASRDIYYVDITAAVPIGQWGITEYAISRDPLYWSSNFFNQNVPEEFASNTAQWGGVGTIYTQVEYCVYVSSGDDRGDVNVPYGDGTVDAADVVFLLNYLFRGGDPPVPYIEGDTNCDGTVSPGDVVYLINYLYKGWPPPRCCN
jgi:hypothetical protein